MNTQDFRKAYNKHSFEHIKAPGARDAAVMIPLVENQDGELSVLFEVRSQKIIQGGEVCFPGGRVEENESPDTTVIREAVEELLIPEDQIHIIAPLFTMNGVGDSFIFSYLAEFQDYKGSYSGDEVGSVFLLPLDELLAMKPRICSAEYVADLPEDFPYELIPGGRNYRWRNRPKNFYFYETRYGVIWGMTAELLYNFLERVRKLEIHN